MKHIYRILELAGPGHDDIDAAEEAHERALDWMNVTSPFDSVAWYEAYQTARDHDPADIIDPIDGLLRFAWHVTVIDTRAAAILRGEA